MPGLRITIPTTFTDTTLPTLKDDAILPESGALMLVDMAHPLSTSPTLEPLALLTNLAADQAAAVTGASASALHPEVYIGGISTTPNAVGLVEYTGSGGLHTILSSTAGSLDGVKVRYPLDVLEYVRDNPTNDYFVSVWMRVTRPTNSTAGWSSISLGTNDSTSNYLYLFANLTTKFPSSAPQLIGLRSTPTTTKLSEGATAGPYIRNIGVSDHTGTVDPAGNLSSNSKIFGVGQIPPFEGSGNNPSAILYRFYMEDLTVSGRTYAEVDAIDDALYTADVLTAGGRYYGDTYTDPATVP